MVPVEEQSVRAQRVVNGSVGSTELRWPEPVKRRGRQRDIEFPWRKPHGPVRPANVRFDPNEPILESAQGMLPDLKEDGVEVYGDGPGLGKARQQSLAQRPRPAPYVQGSELPR